jgi:hypothetical protein
MSYDSYWLLESIMATLDDLEIRFRFRNLLHLHCCKAAQSLGYLLAIRELFSTPKFPRRVAQRSTFLRHNEHGRMSMRQHNELRCAV